ncbi:MAG: macro domain-containing protein [Spirochaetia bacterium]|nr:macro domain-containing protein [Spirochaetia bacterium]
MVQIQKTGITNIKADAIVNAANSSLRHGGGVCGFIFDAAGPKELSVVCNKIGHCDTGSAVITPAFNLDAKYIIHAVGPIYQDGKHNEENDLYNAYKSSLNLAKEYDCHSIVFPLISSGIYGYPKHDACKVAMWAVKNWTKANSDYELDIIFAVPRDPEYSLCLRAMEGELGITNTDKKQSHFSDEETSLLKKINRDELWQLINRISEIRLSMWKEGEELPPEDVMKALRFLGSSQKEVELPPLISEMSVLQIQYSLSNIIAMERWGGVIYDEVGNGNVLKLLLRLDDLIQKLQNESC